MDKNKAHSYGTRRTKAAVREENNENINLTSAAMSKRKLIESPSAAKLCMISGYASPPCRPVPQSQNNENEIEWDLTSPSARKFHVVLTDKKTSTPNQTPTRKRELRPRVALCKKNIVLSVDKSGDLISELAALNDLVNSEQAQNVMTPPRSLKTSSGSDSPIESHKDFSKPRDLSTSDVFDDDSFFSESLLVCTQAIEKEALGTGPCPKKKTNDIVEFQKPPVKGGSPGMNVSRKSFELDFTDSEAFEPNITLGNKILEPKLAVKHPTPVKNIRVTTPSQSLLDTSPVKTRSSPITNVNPVLKSVHSYTNREPTQFTKPPPPKQTSPPRLTRSSTQSNNLMKSPPQSSNCGNGLGITRLCDPPGSKLQKHFAGRNGRMEHAQAIAAPAPKKSCFIQSKDLFDDDDDDLLIAVANEVESQFASSACTHKPTTNDDDDDGFFQPEVLDFISQIETQAISTQKSTAELLEKKRQAAIQRRQQRSNRR